MKKENNLPSYDENHAWRKVWVGGLPICQGSTQETTSAQTTDITSGWRKPIDGWRRYLTRIIQQAASYYMLLSQALLSAVPQYCCPVSRVISTTLNSCHIISLGGQVSSSSSWLQFVGKLTWNLVVHPRSSSSISSLLYLWITLCFPFFVNICFMFTIKNNCFICFESFLNSPSLLETKTPRLRGRFPLWVVQGGWAQGCPRTW